MATQELVQGITREAGADLSSAQFTFGVVDSNGQIVQVSAAGGDADGVINNKPDAAGKPVEFQIGGVAKVVAGAAVDAGVKGQSDASGRVILAASGDHVLCKTLQAAGAAGEVIEVLLVSKHLLA